jgi:transmembrane sensor
MLADASVVELNSESCVEITYTTCVRRIEIKTGEALFHVHHDDRPFRVISGPTVIEGISTDFAVRKTDQWTRVFVMKGWVRPYPRRRLRHQKWQSAR